MAIFQKTPQILEIKTQSNGVFSFRLPSYRRAGRRRPPLSPRRPPGAGPPFRPALSAAPGSLSARPIEIWVEGHAKALAATLPTPAATPPFSPRRASGAGPSSSPRRGRPLASMRGRGQGAATPAEDGQPRSGAGSAEGEASTNG